MTTGALIFAFNNEQTDYVAMAQWSAKNIKRHLGIPTCIITDKDIEVVGSNHRWFDDYKTNVTWHNESRTDAYTLSPWERTLVLDADYVVASDQLKLLLEIDQDFLAHRWAYDITSNDSFEGYNYFGNVRMPMWWATVMMFRKSKQAQLIFECMSMVKANWVHYKKLYRNNSPSYRNDHALSIALGIVNGHTLSHAEIPWPLASLTLEHKLTQLDQDSYRVDFVNPENKSRWITLQQDFHAMGKQQLGEIVASNS
jgi:hypothetical protein